MATSDSLGSPPETKKLKLSPDDDGASSSEDGRNGRVTGDREEEEEEKGGSSGWPELKGSRESHACINRIRLCSEIHFNETLKNCNKDLELLKLAEGTYSV